MIKLFIGGFVKLVIDVMLLAYGIIAHIIIHYFFPVSQSTVWKGRGITMGRMIYVFFAFILLFIFGCSNVKSPVTPNGSDSDNLPYSNLNDLTGSSGEKLTNKGDVILGVFQMVPDPVTGGIEIISLDSRAAAAHYNVISFLKKPYCPIERCWHWEVVHYNWAERIFEIDMAIYNPTIYTGYDVRVVFINLFDQDRDPVTDELITENDITILNPDGWTSIGDDDSKDPDMNPYILFNKEEEPIPPFPNPARAFPPYTIDFERLVMHWPAEQPVGPIYMALASYPDQAEEAIQYLYVDQFPPMDNDIAGFSRVYCTVFDHQGEDPDMHVYLSCPDVLGVDGNDDPVEIEFEKWFIEGNRVFLGWEVLAHNLEVQTRPGDYPAMIRVVTPNPGDFDTYFKFDLKVRRNGGSGEGHTQYDAPIAWTNFEDGDAEIYASRSVWMNNRQNMTHSSDFQDITSCWAKIGNIWYLFYSSDRNDHPFAGPDEDDYDIYVRSYQRQNGEFIEITPDPTHPPCLTGDGWAGDDLTPDISPDLSFMVFSAEQGVGGDREIIRANLGSPPTTITTWVNLTDNSADEGNPTINAFGTYILFDSDALGGNNRDIFGMIPNAGSQVDTILDSGNDDFQPSFNPNLSNSNYFVFTRDDNNGNVNIGRALLSGNTVFELINLTNHRMFDESEEKQASWSPLGNQIIFQSNQGDGSDFEIWTMDIDGSPYDRHTRNDWDDTTPRWGPIP